jgi:hypothetical protein
MEHTILYTSAYVFEIDTVREAFTKANIPFYVQTENLAGVRSAFPASPASGLGTRWHVFVPTEAEVKAKKVLSTLHLSFDSDSKPFFEVNETTFKKNLRKALIIVFPVIAILAYVFYRAYANR